MEWFQSIYRFFQSIFETLSFKHKPQGFEPFYDDESGHTVYEYNFVPINEKFTPTNENTMIRL
jgi:hypothetical protein